MEGFESEFQRWFKRRQDVGYEPVLDEDMERYYAQRLPFKCSHGKDPEWCAECRQKK